MTRYADIVSTGYLPLRHEDPKINIAARAVLFAARIGGPDLGFGPGFDEFGRMRGEAPLYGGEPTHGDILGACLWPTEGDPTPAPTAAPDVSASAAPDTTTALPGGRSNTPGFSLAGTIGFGSATGFPTTTERPPARPPAPPPAPPPTASKRPIPAWSFAWPAITTTSVSSASLNFDSFNTGEGSDEADTNFGPPASGAPSGFGSARPVWSQAWDEDRRFKAISVALPSGGGIPKGTAGLVVAATRETSEEDVFLPSMGNSLIADYYGGNAFLSTLVHDTTKDGHLDQKITGRLDTLTRVAFPTGPLGRLALHGPSLVWADKPASGAVSDATPPNLDQLVGGAVTKILNLSGAGFIIPLVTTAANALRDAAGLPRPKANEGHPGPAGDGQGGEALGFVSFTDGGPFCVGCRDDVHATGKATTGSEPIMPLHLQTGALWLADKVKDGPLDFKKDYYKPNNDVGGVEVETFLRFDTSAGGNAFDPKSGKWRWQTKVPQFRGDKNPIDPIGSSINWGLPADPGATTDGSSTGKNPFTPWQPHDPNRPGGGPSGRPERDKNGYPIYDPSKPVAEQPGYTGGADPHADPKGAVWGLPEPRDPTNTATTDGWGAAIVAAGAAVGSPFLAPPSFSERQPARTDPHVLYCLATLTETVDTAHVFRAQQFDKGQVDLRNKQDWGGREACWFNYYAPAVGRYDVIGNQNAQLWNYSDLPRTGRNGATASGTLSYMPANVGMEQILDGTVPATSPTFNLNLYKTNLTFGTPKNTGLIGTGFGVYLSSDGASLKVDTYSSTGSVSSTGTLWPSSAGTSPPFADNAALVKNNSDATKLAILDASLIATATTRTYSLPDVAGGVLWTDQGDKSGAVVNQFAQNVAGTVKGGPASAAHVGNPLTVAGGDGNGSGQAAGNLSLVAGTAGSGGTVGLVMVGNTGDKVSFYAGTGTTKQTITGSRAGNAAVAAMATAGANLGLWVDGTTA